LIIYSPIFDRPLEVRLDLAQDEAVEICHLPTSTCLVVLVEHTHIDPSQVEPHRLGCADVRSAAGRGTDPPGLVQNDGSHRRRLIRLALLRDLERL